MPEMKKRKHPRLKGYSYSNNGVYFITVCTKNRHEILGEVVGRDALGAPSPRDALGAPSPRDALGASSFQYSQYGAIVRNEIEETPSHYEGVTIDKYVVMPNHIHMIIAINRDDDIVGRDAPGALSPCPSAPGASRPTELIPTIIAILKKKTNRAIGFPIWQTSYHDHIVRDDAEYQRIWEYVDKNHHAWLNDRYHTSPHSIDKSAHPSL